MEHVRSQLVAFCEFTSNTPDPIPHHDYLWWAGDMPATPEEYPLPVPTSDALRIAVLSYIERLVHAARKHTWAKEYLDKLMKQQYADLYAYLDIAKVESW